MLSDEQERLHPTPNSADPSLTQVAIEDIRLPDLQLTLSPGLLTNLIDFIRHPRSEISAGQTLNFRIWDYSRLIGIQLCLASLGSILLTWALIAVDYQGTNAVQEALTNQPIAWFLLQACILAPVLEETAFRLWLKYSPLRVAVGLSLLFFYGFQLLLAESWLQLLSLFSDGATPLEAFLTSMAMTLIVGLVALLVLHNLDDDLVKRSFIRHFRYLYYFSALAFGLIHVSNYSQFSQVWWLIPILVSPQIIFGFGLGYIRLRFGFIWSILAHFLINSLTVLPFVIASLGSPELFQTLIEGDNHQLSRVFTQLSSQDQVLFSLASGSVLVVLGLEVICFIQVIVEYFVHRRVEAKIS